MDSKHITPEIKEAMLELFSAIEYSFGQGEKMEVSYQDCRVISILLEEHEKVKQLEKYIEIKDKSLKEIRRISSGLNFKINQLSINALKINGEA